MVGIPGLDRRAMEAERLARVGAKQPASSGEAQQPSRTEPVIRILKTSSSSKRQRSVSPPPVSRPAKRAKEHDAPSPNISYNSVHYPVGTMKQTWAFGHARTEHDIKIEEVLEKETLHTALLSAFQWDTDWIMGKLNLQQTKVMMVMQADTEAIKQQYLQETAYLGKILRLCFPSMEGNINCMHSKLMLLFHKHKLRIVVPSANLTSYDWGETGVMENSVFIIDLVRAETPTTDMTTMPQFGQELLFFLEKMGVDEDMRKGVLKFDFTVTKHLAFVHSVGGAHHGTDMERTGYVGLGKAIRELNTDIPGQPESSYRTTSDLKIDFAASSIGSLHDDFLTTIHNAARGEDATAPPTCLSRTAPRPFQNTTSTSKIRDSFRIYFPTHQTVQNSTGGTDNGGTICLQAKWWKGDNFPRSCFRDYRSKRTGMLSHNKILYARGVNSQGKKVAWRYMGSANLSESAWGKVSWDRKEKQWKIACRNWECGVVIPVLKDGYFEQLGRTEMKRNGYGVVMVSDDEEDAETESEDEGDKKVTDKMAGKGKAAAKTLEEEAKPEVPGMDVFSSGTDTFNAGFNVDMPFEYPGAEYNGKDPWFFMG